MNLFADLQHQENMDMIENLTSLDFTTILIDSLVMHQIMIIGFEITQLNMLTMRFLICISGFCMQCSSICIRYQIHLKAIKQKKLEMV